MDGCEEENLFEIIIKTIKFNKFEDFFKAFDAYLHYTFNNSDFYYHLNDIENIHLKLKIIPEYAAQFNRIDILDFCRINDIKITLQVSKIATKFGNINVLEWCRINKIFMSTEIPNIAAYYGQTNILNWCKENNINLTSEEFFNYACLSEKNEDVLKWYLLSETLVNKCELVKRKLVKCELN